VETREAHIKKPTEEIQGTTLSLEEMLGYGSVS
jgi:hypothetical protein